MCAQHLHKLSTMLEKQKEFGESTVSKILDLVENASSKKANTENFITKFARIYTPIVVGAALVCSRWVEPQLTLMRLTREPLSM
jgi:cation transport ATPase